MKNGTTPFDFLPGNERSRTDVPRGTGELSHGPHRRAMADPPRTPATTFRPREAPDGLPSGGRQRDLPRPSQRLRLAASAPRIPEMEDRLRDLPCLAQRRDVAADPRGTAGQAP